MYAAVVIVAVVLIAKVTGQEDCTAEIAAFKQCMRGNQTETQPDFQAIQQAMDQCYTSNGCTPPSQNTDQSDCMKQVFDSQIKPAIESCAAAQIPGFVWEESGPRGAKGHFGGPGGAFGKKGPRGSCPSKQAERQMQNCLRQQQPATRGQWKNGDRNKRDCFSALSSTCKQQMEAEKQLREQVLCNCSQSLQNDQAIQSALAACPVPTGAPSRGPPRNNNNNIFGRFCDGDKKHGPGGRDKSGEKNGFGGRGSRGRGSNGRLGISQ